MDKSTVVVSNTDADDLAELVSNIQRLTGAPIRIEVQYVLTCENPQVQAALAQLFAGARPVSAETAAKSKPGRKKKAKQEPAPFALKKGPKRQLRSWHVLDDNKTTQERITVEEKDARLERGDFREGTLLAHPREGKFIVIGLSGSPQTSEPLS